MTPEEAENFVREAARTAELVEALIDNYIDYCWIRNVKPEARRILLLQEKASRDLAERVGDLEFRIADPVPVPPVPDVQDGGTDA